MKRLILTLALCCAAHSAWAQPVSCARSPLIRLAPLVGQWRVAWESRVNGELVTVDGSRATIEWATEECAIVEHLTGRLRESPMELTARLTAPTRNTLQLAYVDSDHGDLLMFDGAVEGDTVRFAWSRALDARTLMVRREYSEITPLGFLTTTLMSPDSGQTWTLVQRARYERAP